MKGEGNASRVKLIAWVMKEGNALFLNFTYGAKYRAETSAEPGVKHYFIFLQELLLNYPS